MRRHKKYPCFTLIELMVVASIIVILMMIGGIYYNSVSKTSRDNQRRADLKTLSVALEIYFSRNGRYPLEDASGECDTSYGLRDASCSGMAVPGWQGDLNDLKTAGILDKLPLDSRNKSPYYYIFELDKAGTPGTEEGKPPCHGVGITPTKTCRYILQTLLENGPRLDGSRGECIYTLQGGEGVPQGDVNPQGSSPDCSGTVFPFFWAGKPCCKM